MKKLISLSLFLLCSLCVNAQKTLILEKTDGSTVTIPVEDLKRFYFNIPEDVIPKRPEFLEAVDLGLSVKWANVNYGAENETQSGLLVGWGDTTGTKTSTDLDEYPNANPPKSIARTQYDIVFNSWGKDYEEDWRMPTSSELDELVSRCSWNWDSDRSGYIVTGPSGNSIFLPVTGRRSGSDLKEPARGYYWSATLSDEKDSESNDLYFSSKDYYVERMNRSTGMAIRPVLGNEAPPSGGDPTPVTGEFAYVDLGLSVKWATFNIGATKDTEPGGHYGWGDPKGTNTSDNPNQYAKNVYGPADISVSPYDTLDIVHVKLGGNWHMPTKAQFEELSKCKIRYTSNYKNSGIGGYIVTGIGNYSSNEVFFPGAGARTMVNSEGNEVIEGETQTYYWTANLSGESDSFNRAYFARFTGTSSLNTYTDRKCLGMSIRPVWVPNSGSSEPIVDPDPQPSTDGYTTLEDGSLKPDAAVDLGLSVKWASCNLGARTTQANDYGNYYSWGELTPKDSYTNSTYDSPYKNISGWNIKDYQISQENDAAAQLWGDGWRMPTTEEFEELVTNTTVSWNYPIGGMQFTGRNGRYIIIPAAGIKISTNIENSGQLWYWTSSIFGTTLENEQKSWATCVFYQNNLDGTPTRGYYRYAGMPIRPVRK